MTLRILSTYVDIDSSDIKRFFGRVDMFAHFTEHFTGAEHSLADDITIENYRHYSSIARLLRNKGLWGNDSKIQNDTVLQYDLIRDIAHMTSASCTEISRFLHLPLGRVQDVTGRRF